MNIEGYDFSGWASKNDLRCGDGRIIRSGAFSHNDKLRVPLVWNHRHNSADKILGHAILENRPEGVYAYGFFNNTENGKNAKEAVQHGDVTAMSIWANNLEQNGSEVLHGNIREVSLVLAGANPGAFIESVVSHGEPMDEYDDEGIFYTDESLVLEHAIEVSKKEEKMRKEEDTAKKETSGDGETVGEVFNTLTDKQKEAVAIMIGMAVSDKEKKDEEEEEEEEMKHHLFDEDDRGDTRFLSHSDMEKIFADAKRIGSLREAVNQNIEEGGVLAHSVDTTGMDVPSAWPSNVTKYGFNSPDMLFPEFKTLNNPPEWISRNMDWVQKVMNGVSRTPFSRIKSVFADITEDDARARGYIKGKLKKEEFFTTMKRTTTPQTIYKKQKLDRDDIIDITDFDVVAWIRAEMRVMLNEEIARAILIGDGRLSSSDDHISEDHIRPIVKDVPLFNIIAKVSVAYDATDEDIARETIRTVIKARKDYKGSGTPSFYTIEDTVTDMLLLEDKVGHRLYKTEQELSTAMRVNEYVTVEPMSGTTVSVKEGETTKSYPLLGVVVNLKDYNVGADRGGEINMFDDFDIDYNQQKYLIETRCSGALIRPYSAITVVLDRAAKPAPGGTGG